MDFSRSGFRAPMAAAQPRKLNHDPSLESPLGNRQRKLGKLWLGHAAVFAQ